MYLLRKVRIFLLLKMPFKFVFPYWTILSIIVVGGLCVFVDLWWGVKPV